MQPGGARACSASVLASAANSKMKSKSALTARSTSNLNCRAGRGCGRAPGGAGARCRPRPWPARLRAQRARGRARSPVPPPPPERSRPEVTASTCAANPGLSQRLNAAEGDTAVLAHAALSTCLGVYGQGSQREQRQEATDRACVHSCLHYAAP